MNKQVELLNVKRLTDEEYKASLDSYALRIKFGTAPVSQAVQDGWRAAVLYMMRSANSKPFCGYPPGAVYLGGFGVDEAGWIAYFVHADEAERMAARHNVSLRPPVDFNEALPPGWVVEFNQLDREPEPAFVARGIT